VELFLGAHPVGKRARQPVGWPAYCSVEQRFFSEIRKEAAGDVFDPFEGSSKPLFFSQQSMVLDPKTHNTKWKSPDE